MVHDLVVRGRSRRTQAAYLAAVAGLAKHYHQRPDALSPQQVESYIGHLLEQRPLAANSLRIAVVRLRFFSTVTLHRQTFPLPLPKGARELPEVLSRAEVTRLPSNTLTLRARAGDRGSPTVPTLDRGASLSFPCCPPPPRPQLSALAGCRRPLRDHWQRPLDSLEFP
jgi:hypothetical protein